MRKRNDIWPLPFYLAKMKEEISALHCNANALCCGCIDLIYHSFLFWHNGNCIIGSANSLCVHAFTCRETWTTEFCAAYWSIQVKIETIYYLLWFFVENIVAKLSVRDFTRRKKLLSNEWAESFIVTHSDESHISNDSNNERMLAMWRLLVSFNFLCANFFSFSTQQSQYY